MKLQASATKDAKFFAVFSQRSAMRLKRLSLPTAISMRDLALYRMFGKFLGLSLALDFCGTTGTMPRFRHRARLALLS